MAQYKMLKVVDADQVPDWERRPPKWSELVDAVLELKAGQSLPVEFKSITEAERARNAVRDMANLKANAAVVRTRLVRQGDHATLYLIRVHPVDTEK